MTEFNDMEYENEDTQYGRYITFMLSNECYGLGIKNVTEIIGIQKVTEIPEAPDYMKGIINLRGLIIPIIDARLKFKKTEAEYTDRTCIIVVDIGELSVGLIVDMVSEVSSIDDDDISPPPDVRLGIKSKYIMGIGKTKDGVVLLLDCEKLFFEDEVELMSKICEEN